MRWTASPVATAHRRRQAPLWIGGLAIIAALLATTSTTTARPAPRPSFWGLNLALYNSLSLPDAARLSRLHLRTMRVTIGWSDVEPTPTTTNWSKPDELMERLALLGIRPQPLLFSSPFWVNGRTVPVAGLPLDGQTHATPPVGSPLARAAWKGFVRAAVNRYKPGGAFWTGPFARDHPGVKPMPVVRWQIWNEPNVPQFFDPRPSVSKYARLLQIAHAGVRAADPNARIALAGIPSTPSFPAASFLRQLYEVPGIKRDFDIVAAHPYGSSVQEVKANTFAIRRAMRAAHDARTPLWVDEIGWGSAPSDGNRNVGLDGQARLLRRTLEMLARNRQRLHLEEVSWFDLRDPWSSARTDCAWCGYAGLIDWEDSPKPSWSVFRQVIARR